EHVHIAQWPGVKELHQLASRHYAFEGQCYVLACGTALTRGQALAGFDSTRQADPLARSLLSEIPGDDDTLLLPGASSVIAPDSAYVLEPAAASTDLLLADLPMQALVEGWLTLDTDGHYSRPDVFELTVNQKALKNVRFTASPTSVDPSD
ncbi:MAG: nitrilase-related carbon-nitrogen hydrolase, partial [Pseudomonadota bacterium]